ncbi:hypothetical protein MNV49_000892, partial [Pseudohyphozyma bogoriensis]
MSTKSTVTWAKEAVVEEVKESKVAFWEIWHFARTHDWRKTAKQVFRRKYWGWWILLAVTIALSAVLSSKHSQIIAAIGPYKKVIREQKWSWIIPTVVLVIISFPPLFGHELVILAVGVIYGLGIGFIIACLGTFLGELATFYAFRYLFAEKAKQIEAKQVAYSCLAKLMREGGLKMIILVRFSAVPGHVTTAVQSTVGMSVWIYSIAAIVSLPKQFALVYLGVVFGQTGGTLEEWRKTHSEEVPLSVYYDGKGTEAKRHRISLYVFAATTVATFFAAYIVWRRIRRIRPEVVREMEERKALEAAQGGITASGQPATPSALEMASTPRPTPLNLHLPLSKSLHRPPFVAANSFDGLNGSQVALLGRSRSGTV